MNKYSWISKFNRISKQNDGFAVNIFNNAEEACNLFKKISDMGATIDIEDYETIILEFPIDLEITKNILLELYKFGPYPNSVCELEDGKLQICWS